MRLLASLFAFVALALAAGISLKLGYPDRFALTGDPRALRKALALNPYYARGWIELGLQAELAGDRAEAERLFLRAAEVDRTYEPRWALANFYFRRGDREAFWRWSRAAAEIAYLDQTALFDLCWRTSPEPAEILDKAIPHQPRVLAQYLGFLMDRRNLEAAGPVAGLLVSKGGPALAPLMLTYCDRLLQNGQTAEAVELWNTLCARLIIKRQPLRPETGVSLSNGDFRATPLAAGFDWRPFRTEGVRTTVRESPGELSVAFNGEEPEGCRVFEQVLPLVPSHEYRLRYLFRTSGIAAGSGVRWEIAPLRGSAQWSAVSANLSAEVWRQEEFAFVTPDHVGAARLSLAYRRAYGTTRIEGSIHLRAVSLSFGP